MEKNILLFNQFLNEIDEFDDDFDFEEDWEEDFPPNFKFIKIGSAYYLQSHDNMIYKDYQLDDRRQREIEQLNKSELNRIKRNQINISIYVEGSTYGWESLKYKDLIKKYPNLLY